MYVTHHIVTLMHYSLLLLLIDHVIYLCQKGYDFVSLCLSVCKLVVSLRLVFVDFMKFMDG